MNEHLWTVLQKLLKDMELHLSRRNIQRVSGYYKHFVRNTYNKTTTLHIIYYFQNINIKLATYKQITSLFFIQFITSNNI